MVERLAAEHPGITVGWTPGREGDNWLWLATKLRLAQDFLRYLDPRYDKAPQLRQRAEERTPLAVLALIRMAGLRTRAGRTILGGLLQMLEQAIPRSRDLDGFMEEQAPDLVLITPLVDLGSPQLDHLKSARAAGARTVLSVGSWDHLSSKSLIRIVPDRITVWNETQKAEAVELHGVPADRVVVTGAQCFDQWFDRRPSRSREDFCRRMNLPPDRPYVLWVCSSLFRGSRPEAELVEQWVARVRGCADPVLRQAGILVRPHPARLDEWRRVDLSGFEHVALRGGNPVDAAAKADYFDSLYYAAAIVGLNTSALLEAGIAGRPVLTIVHEDYWKNQSGTLHWQYLLDVGGGLLRVARSFDEHLEQLAAAVGDTAFDGNRRFVESFIRPQGLETPSTPLFAAAIEDLGRAPAPARQGAPAWALLLRPALYPLIWLRMLRTAVRQWRKSSRRGFKRWWQTTRKSMRLAVKQLILKRLQTEEPQVVLPKAERVRARAERLFESVEEVEETKEALSRLAQSREPIIVGPWLSETGFELLYWIPVLNWAKTYASLRDDRLVVISRGGAGSWYRHLTPHYRDVFDYYTPEEFRARNDDRIAQQGGRQKHVTLAEFDREIIERVKATIGAPAAESLHPSLMYNLFRIFWRLQASVGLVQGFTLHRRITPPPLEGLAGSLPDDYVAVKFYSNHSFPDTPQNRAFVTDYLRRLTDSHHVVLLNTGVRYDDHDDFAPERRERIHTVDHLMVPRHNLDVQTRIISHARAFIGTYGGFSYLAPLCGVDTLAFFSDPTGFRVDHLEVAKRVFTDLAAGSFVALDVRDINVLRIGLGLPDDLLETTAGRDARVALK
jgi:hypothetical protein